MKLNTKISGKRISSKHELIYQNVYETNWKRQFDEILGERSDDMHIWKNIES